MFAEATWKVSLETSNSSKIFGVVQSIGQLLGNKDILNGVEFSTIPEQNQGLLGGTQNIRQIANVGESTEPILPV